MITTTTTTTTTRNSSNSNNNNNIHKQQQQQQQQRRGTTTTQRLTTTKKLTTSPLFSASSTTIQNNNQNNNKFVSALGPLSLLGGTAAVYTSSVLHHPSSTLTPLSVLYMVLLALQYSIQPRLSRKHIRSDASKQSVAFVEEITKTAIAAAVVAAATMSASTTTTKPASNWSLSSSLTVAGLPAILYAVQGVLQYQSQQHLDAVTYNGLTQTKTLFAAVCCFALLGKKQSLVQTLSLLVLLLSSLVFQGIVVPTVRVMPPSPNNKHTASASAAAAIANNNKHQNKNKKKTIDFFWKGVVPCLTATFLSGLAGALSQKGLQVYNRDAYVYTIEISVFSALTLLASMFCTGVFNHHNDAAATNHNKKSTITKQQQIPSRFSFFRGWTKETWIPIVCKAFGGVLTALVHKHAGSVSKGFALMFGLVLSGCFASFATTTGKEKEGSSLKPHQWWGTVLVLVSGWMHFTHPPK